MDPRSDSVPKTAMMFSHDDAGMTTDDRFKDDLEMLALFLHVEPLLQSVC